MNSLSPRRSAPEMAEDAQRHGREWHRGQSSARAFFVAAHPSQRPPARRLRIIADPDRKPEPSTRPGSGRCNHPRQDSSTGNWPIEQRRRRDTQQTAGWAPASRLSSDTANTAQPAANRPQNGRHLPNKLKVGGQVRFSHLLHRTCKNNRYCAQ